MGAVARSSESGNQGLGYFRRNTRGTVFFFCWFDVHKNGTRGWEVPGCNLLDIIEIVEIQLEPHAISRRFPQPPLQGKAGE